MPDHDPISLGKLRKGQKAEIVSVSSAADGFGSRLLEMGFLEGSGVEIIHEAPWGGDPIVVRVRGALIALRRREADHVLVEVSHGS